MVGREGWDAFAASPEASDGLDHPLDRWSRRLIEALARELGGKALFPFGGPPFLPFQRWAERAEPVHSSPIGLLIHPDYGLWHSYRGALGFAEALDAPEPAAGAEPMRILRGPLVPENLSRRRVYRRRLRRDGLRGSPSKPSRRGLHGLWLPGPPGVPSRRGTRLQSGTVEFHHAGVSARAGRRLRTRCLRRGNLEDRPAGDGIVRRAPRHRSDAPGQSSGRPAGAAGARCSGRRSRSRPRARRDRQGRGVRRSSAQPRVRALTSRRDRPHASPARANVFRGERAAPAP